MSGSYGEVLFFFLVSRARDACCMVIFMFLGRNCVEIKTKYIYLYMKCPQNTKKKLPRDFTKAKTKHDQFLAIRLIQETIGLKIKKFGSR